MTAGVPPNLDRRARLRGKLHEGDIAAAVIWQQPTVCYLTGNQIPGPNALVLLPDGEWVVVCDAYDAPNFAAAAPDLPLVTYHYASSLAAETATLLHRRGLRRGNLGIEFGEVRESLFATLRLQLRPVRMSPIDAIIGDLRLVKDDEELAIIRRAAAIVQTTMQSVTTWIHEAISESELAARIYGELVRSGSQYTASQPYIKSGERSFLTHARWSNRQITTTDHVLIEIGASVDRYHASLMRSRLQPKASRAYHRACEAVLAGRDAYLRYARPGVSAHALHQAYLDALAASGVAHWSRHPSGYSLGIAFPPYWGELPLLTITTGNERLLESGMVLHLISGVCEPAASVPHIGLSECVVITRGGAERLIEVSDFL